MEYTFLSATVLLVLITDPLGNIPIFISALRQVAPERRSRVVLREVGIAFVLLLVFMFFGESFLRMMSLTDMSLQIAGGIVLFLIALRMIFPREGAAESQPTGEPFIVPLAIPAIAGPSAMATVMLFMRDDGRVRRGTAERHAHSAPRRRTHGDGLRASDGADSGGDFGGDAAQGHPHIRASTLNHARATKKGD